jgi:peroxiredoxin
VELQDRLDELRADGLGVAAISYDPPDVLADFAERRGISFSLLSDDDSATIAAFGLLNTVAEEGLGPNGDDPTVKADVERYVSLLGPSPRIVGTPFPGTFLIDRQGRVTARFFEEFYRERNTTASIMLRLGTNMNPVAGLKGSTAHLEITAHQSDAEIAVGSHLTLALDIDPKPGMHVYAPGADDLGYQVVGLTISPEPFVQLLPLQYPSSEIYHFEPLDERVPVYQKPFTLIQEVVIEATEEAEEALHGVDVVSLTGRLDYQACDAEICFEPVSIPLSWTLTLSTLDRQRAKRP